MAKTAAKKLDVYRDWLNIAETVRPLNHYQLLKLTMFEDDVAKIRTGYRQLNAHIRKYSTGEYGSESQALLNELAKAMLCLTDAQRKREYDITLGRKEKGEGRRRSLEEILLANKVVTSEQLAKARAFSSAVGLEIRDAILQQRLATQDVVMQAYAEAEGRSYLDPASDMTLDPSLIVQIPAPIVRTHSCVPVMIDGDRVLVASPKPLDPGLEDQFRLRFGMPVWWVVCTPQSLTEVIAKYYSREALNAANLAAAEKQVAAKKAGAKSGTPKTAPAKIAPAKKAAADDDPEEVGEAASPQDRLKKAFMVGWIAIVVLFILYAMYKMFF